MASAGGLKHYLTNEKFDQGSIPTTQQLHIIDLSSYLSHFLSQGTMISSPDSELKIYPNPAKNYFFLSRSNGAPIGQFELYDHLGVIRYQSQSDAGTMQIDANELKPGFYYYKVFSINAVFSGKLLKE
jgi:hypothetical protein